MPPRARPGIARWPYQQTIEACLASRALDRPAYAPQSPARRPAAERPHASLAGRLPCRLSAACELRWSLLHEGCDALGVIGCVSQLALVVALDVELLIEASGQALVHCLLGACETSCWR